MRSLEINKRDIFYAQPIRTEEVGDFDETKTIYGIPEKVSIKVEYVNSSVSITEYNKDSQCDVKLTTSKITLPFDETTRFWIDVPTSDPHDYVLAKLPQKSINGTVYRLKKVGVSHA